MICVQLTHDCFANPESYALCTFGNIWQRGGTVQELAAAVLTSLEPIGHRVPFVDAKRYVAALRAREGAPEATTFVFDEDTHALDRPQTEFEQWINVAAFLDRHIGE